MVSAVAVRPAGCQRVLPDELAPAASIAQLTMFILKRSPFSNSGIFSMSSRYFCFASCSTALACCWVSPNSVVKCWVNDPWNAAHIAIGNPAYFIVFPPVFNPKSQQSCLCQTACFSASNYNRLGCEMQPVSGSLCFADGRQWAEKPENAVSLARKPHLCYTVVSQEKLRRMLAGGTLCL